MQKQYQDLHFKMVALGAGRDEPSQLLQLLSICHNFFKVTCNENEAEMLRINFVNKPYT